MFGVARALYVWFISSCSIPSIAEDGDGVQLAFAENEYRLNNVDSDAWAVLQTSGVSDCYSQAVSSVSLG